MNRRRFSVVRLCLSVLVVGLLLFPFACEPGGYVNIQNLQNQEVTIFMIDVPAGASPDIPVKQGVVSPNASKQFGMVFLGSNFVERIEARDQSGKVVFSHDYKFDDMEKIGWKITIPP